MSYKSTVKEFLQRYEQSKDSIQKQLEEVGVKNIKAETPVVSGELRDGNNAITKDDTTYFYNIKDYAPYVHLGTYKQNANPFMIRGIMKSKNEFFAIMVKELKI